MIDQLSDQKRFETEDENSSETGTHASTGGKDLWDSFLRLPFAEKLLSGAAAAVTVGWLITAQWSQLFDFGDPGGWFATFAAFGAGSTIVLLFVKVLNIPWLNRTAHSRLLIVCALLPALGLLVELTLNFWYAVMLIGALAMAWAAGKITTRDELLKP